MGDRANIYVKDGDVGVWLYTHWAGYKQPAVLRQALRDGRDRWDDTFYLGRIIFDRMIGKEQGTLTGYGISARIGDNEYPILIVDPDAKTVQLGNEPTESGAPLPYGHAWTFEEWCALPDPLDFDHVKHWAGVTP